MPCTMPPVTDAAQIATITMPVQATCPVELRLATIETWFPDMQNEAPVPISRAAMSFLLSQLFTGVFALVAEESSALLRTGGFFQ